MSDKLSEAAGREERDAVHAFVHEQTLARYMELLEATADPEVRGRIRERLVEAEDRFGRSRERLDRAELFIARLEARLREQEAWITDLAAKGADTAPAERLRQTAAETLRLFEAYRGLLRRGLDRSAP